MLSFINTEINVATCLKKPGQVDPHWAALVVAMSKRHAGVDPEPDGAGAAEAGAAARSEVPLSKLSKSNRWQQVHTQVGGSVGAGGRFPSPRSGHTSFVHRGRVWAWGGYCGDGADADLDHMCSYNPVQQIWDRVAIPHPTYLDQVWPVSISGSTVAVVGSRYAVFLIGFAQLDVQIVEPHTNRIAVLDLATTSWLTTNLLALDDGIRLGYGYTDAEVAQEPRTDLTITPGRQPQCKDKHAACIYKNRMVVFGGWGPRPLEHEGDDFEPADGGDPNGLGWHAELAVLDLAELAHPGVHGGAEVGAAAGFNAEWTFPPHRGIGERPCPRAASTLTRVGDGAILFGGRAKGGRLNDVWRLDLIAMEWSLVAPCTESPLVPIARSWHCAEAVGTTRIFIYGGLSCDLGDDGGGMSLGDAWFLDVPTGIWTELVVPDLGPDSARFWHTSSKVGEDIVIFGGTHTDHDGYVPGVTPVQHETQLASVIQFQSRVPKLEAICQRAVQRAVAGGAMQPEWLHAAGIPRGVAGRCLEYASGECPPWQPLRGGD